MVKLEDNQLKVKNKMTLLQKEVEGVGYQVKMITDALKLLHTYLPNFMIYVSHLSARFTVTNDIINEIATNWKDGKVDHKMLDLFNFSLPCSPDCNLKLAEPRDCILNEDKRIINIIFDIKSTNPNVSIMTADSFTYILKVI